MNSMRVFNGSNFVSERRRREALYRGATKYEYPAPSSRLVEEVSELRMKLAVPKKICR